MSRRAAFEMDPEDASYVCSLDAASVKKAREELNELPEDRLAAVKALRDWIKTQPHLRAKTDTITLLAFLRHSKFSQLRAREMVEGQLTIFTQNPTWFRNIDPLENQIQEVMKAGYVFPLPKRDKNGCQILLYRLGAMDAEQAKRLRPASIRMAMMVGMIYSANELTQVNGHVFIFDFTGMTMKHVTNSMNDDMMKKWHKTWQKNMPGRFKAFHYYNAGSLFDALMALARPFLDKKYQDRIQTHDTLESLYKHVDKSLLPEEYLPDDYTGPNVGSLQQISANLIKQVTEPAFREKLLHDTSPDVYGIDETKRPKDVEPPTASFRKLNVD